MMMIKIRIITNIMKMVVMIQWCWYHHDGKHDDNLEEKDYNDDKHISTNYHADDDCY